MNIFPQNLFSKNTISELQLDKILEDVGNNPYAGMDYFDSDLLAQYAMTYWEPKNSWFYPFPISPKLSSNNPLLWHPFNYPVTLTGLKLMDIHLNINPQDLFVNFKPKYISISSFENTTSQQQVFLTPEWSEIITETTTITKTRALKTGVENSIKTNLDVFGLASIEYTAKITVEGNWSTTNTETTTVAKTLRIPPTNVVVPPKTKIIIRSQFFQADVTDINLTVDAKLKGPYIFNNGYANYKGDLYPYLKIMQILFPQLWNQRIGSKGIVLNDSDETVSTLGLGLLNANVTATSYNLVAEEYPINSDSASSMQILNTWQF